MALDQIRDLVPILVNLSSLLALHQVNVAPVMPASSGRAYWTGGSAFIGCSKVEEDSFRSHVRQAAMNAIGQSFKGLAHASIQQALEILQQELAADQFNELLLFFDDFPIFGFN